MIVLSIQPEPWLKFWPECLPLMRLHHDEIEDKRTAYPLDPDVENCARLCDLDAAQILVARDDGVMVGYCVFYIGPNLESKGVIVGTQGPWFVATAYRGGTVAFRLFAGSLDELKRRGVSLVQPHHWLRGDSTKAAALFKRFGAVEQELVYTLRL